MWPSCVEYLLHPELLLCRTDGCRVIPPNPPHVIPVLTIHQSSTAPLPLRLRDPMGRPPDGQLKLLSASHASSKVQRHCPRQSQVRVVGVRACVRARACLLESPCPFPLVTAGLCCTINSTSLSLLRRPRSPPPNCCRPLVILTYHLTSPHVASRSSLA